MNDGLGLCKKSSGDYFAPPQDEGHMCMVCEKAGREILRCDKSMLPTKTTAPRPAYGAGLTQPLRAALFVPMSKKHGSGTNACSVEAIKIFGFAEGLPHATGKVSLVVMLPLAPASTSPQTGLAALACPAGRWGPGLAARLLIRSQALPLNWEAKPRAGNRGGRSGSSER
jgi:hypothetical protein